MFLCSLSCISNCWKIIRIRYSLVLNGQNWKTTLRSGHTLAMFTISSGSSGYLSWKRSISISCPNSQNYHILAALCQKNLGTRLQPSQRIYCDFIWKSTFYKRKFVNNNGKCSEHLENCQFFYIRVLVFYQENEIYLL